MNARTLLPAAISALVLSACASTSRTPLPALDTPTDVELDYGARVAPGIWELVDEPNADDPVIDLEAVDTFIDLDATFVSLDAEQIGELFAEARFAPWAVTTSHSSAARVLRELGDTVAHRQRLTIAEDQRGYVMIARQIAYIERFDVEHAGNVSIADPVVGVAADGLKMEFVGRVVDQAVDLEIELVQNQLQRPVAQMDVDLPGLQTPLTIQQPITSQQTMNLAPVLGENQALLFAIPMTGETGRFLVGHVSARIVTRDDIGIESLIERATDESVRSEADASGDVQEVSEREAPSAPTHPGRTRSVSDAVDHSIAR